MKWRRDIKVNPDNTLHIWPEDEEREHVLKGTSCECAPRIQREGKTRLVIHHSYKISCKRRSR